MASSLSKEARHLVHVLAILADQKTGSGTHGQKTIADAMGASERHVRGLLAELESSAGPVRLERSARFRSDGRGRTSDAWKLVLVQPAQLAGETTEQPAQSSGETDGLTGTPRTTNRQTTHDQPAQRAGDLLSDLLSDRNTPVPSHGKGSRKPKKKQPKPTPPPHPNTNPLKLHYVQTFKQSRGNKPDWTPSDHGRVGKAFRLLAEAFNGDLAVQKQVISTALLDEFAPVTDPRVIYNRRDQFVGQEPRRKSPGTKPHVQSHGHLVSVNREGF